VTKLELSWRQARYRVFGRNPAGELRKEFIGAKSGTLLKGIQEDFDDKRHAIDFMIGQSQLAEMMPQGFNELVETHYKVKSLSLNFTVDVWQRDTQSYESQEVEHKMEDLDVEWQR
jgi:CYTH domain-containing protein